MQDRRDREDFLMLIEVDVRREDGDQERDQAPGGEAGGPRDQEQEAEDDFEQAAQEDEESVIGEIGRHDLEVDVRDREMADPGDDEQAAERPAADRSGPERRSAIAPSSAAILEAVAGPAELRWGSVPWLRKIRSAGEGLRARAETPASLRSVSSRKRSRSPFNRARWARPASVMAVPLRSSSCNSPSPVGLGDPGVADASVGEPEDSETLQAARAGRGRRRRRGPAEPKLAEAGQRGDRGEAGVADSAVGEVKLAEVRETGEVRDAGVADVVSRSSSRSRPERPGEVGEAGVGDRGAVEGQDCSRSFRPASAARSSSAIGPASRWMALTEWTNALAEDRLGHRGSTCADSALDVGDRRRPQFGRMSLASRRERASGRDGRDVFVVDGRQAAESLAHLHGPLPAAGLVGHEKQTIAAAGIADEDQPSQPDAPTVGEGC